MPLSLSFSFLIIFIERNPQRVEYCNIYHINIDVKLMLIKNQYSHTRTFWFYSMFENSANKKNKYFITDSILAEVVPGSWSSLWLNSHLIIRLQIYHAAHKTQFRIVSQSCWRSLLILSVKYLLKFNQNSEWSLSRWIFFMILDPELLYSKSVEWFGIA